MILVFRYEQEAEISRSTPEGLPGRLGPLYATYNTEKELSESPPHDQGEYVAYESAGKDSKRNVPPRFEFLKWITVGPPPASEPEITTSKKF